MLSQAEKNLLSHLMMFGPSAFPISKCGRNWQTDEFFGVQLPGVYKTKLEASDSVKRYLDALIERTTDHD